MTGIGAKVRLTPEARERQPEIGDDIGTVLDLGQGATKVRWWRTDAWHKSEDLEPTQKTP